MNANRASKGNYLKSSAIITSVYLFKQTISLIYSFYNKIPEGGFSHVNGQNANLSCIIRDFDFILLHGDI